MLTQLRAVRQQGEYKAAVALALASLVGPPGSGYGHFYANALNLGEKRLGGWKPQPHEVMVDLAFMHRTRGTDAWSVVAAAESEAWPKHATTLDATCDDEMDVGYFWDLWKLLHFWAPMRVFLAVTRPGHEDELLGELRKYADRYVDERVFVPNDRLFIAVVKDQDAAEWMRVDCATYDGRALRWDSGDWVGDEVAT